MKDIILIETPFCHPTCPSAGIAMIYAFLKQHGINVVVHDLNGELFQRDMGNSDDIQERHRWVEKQCLNPDQYKHISSIDFDTRCIGLSIMREEQVAYALEINRYIKRNHPHITTVIGGAYLFDSPDNTRIFSEFDHVVSGDGEVPLLRILRGTDVPEVSVNELPTPDYSWANLDNYYKRDRTLYYQSSKGCAWNKCAFCSRRKSKQSPYRRKTKEVVQRDFIELKRQNPNLETVFFVDEFITYSALNEYADAFLQAPELKGVTWGSFLRIDTRYTDEMVQKLYDSGYRWCRFGVESFQQRVLDLIKKGSRASAIIPNIEMFWRHGIHVTALMMQHLPKQTMLEIYKDVETILKLSDKCHWMMRRFRFTKWTDIHRNPEEYDLDRNEIEKMFATGCEAFWLRNNKPIPVNSEPPLTGMKGGWRGGLDGGIPTSIVDYM